MWTNVLSCYVCRYGEVSLVILVLANPAFTLARPQSLTIAYLKIFHLLNHLSYGKTGHKHTICFSAFLQNEFKSYVACLLPSLSSTKQVIAGVADILNLLFIDYTNGLRDTWAGYNAG